MISELYIRDLAIIHELRLPLAEGFNVLTGETGAGKSIILDAMTLLLGGRADTTLVRDGSERAYVEGTFKLSADLIQKFKPLLEKEGLDEEDASELLLSRELRKSGRNICRVNGRTVTLNILKDLGSSLIDIHGQGEHLSLLLPKSHLPLLDAYAGLEEKRAKFATRVQTLRKVEAEFNELQRNKRSIAQRADMLGFQIAEISEANLQVGEEVDLKSEQKRLGNVEQLLRSVREALMLISNEDDDTPSAMDLLSSAEKPMEALTLLDDAQVSLLKRLQGFSFELNELTADLQDYQESLDFEPNRLSEVEDRLTLIGTLKRKYGDDIATILKLQDDAETELSKIEHSDTRIIELGEEREKLLKELSRMGEALSKKRKTAAKKLSAVVVTQLADLKMNGAKFNVDFKTNPAEHGAYVGGERIAFDETGIDQVEFLISANQGESLKPMAKVASGGETARLMLALKKALAEVDQTPTLIFDEIDQGIGGRIGNIVGEKLWKLSSEGGHQVLIVTHLPQMAGYGDVHFQVAKTQEDGRTQTHVNRLDTEGRVQELAAMLGTQETMARGGAVSILETVAAAKNGI